MTPEEVSFLQFVGEQLVLTIVYSNLLGTILWGVHAAVTFSALISFRRRLGGRLYVKLMFGLLILIFALSTSVLAIQWTKTIDAMRLTFIKNPDLTLPQRWHLAALRYGKLSLPVDWLTQNGGLLFLIGDIVVITRAYFLWPRSKIYFIFPAFMVIVSFGCTIASNLLIPDVSHIENANNYAITVTTSLVCSIVANAFVTVMLGYQAFLNYKAMKGLMKSRALVVMFYLVDAGVFYFVIQVINLFLTEFVTEPFTAFDYAERCFQTLTFYVSTTYPAAVILLVSSNMSLGSESMVQDSNGRTFDAGTHMSFKRPTHPSRQMSTEQQYSMAENNSVFSTTDGEISRDKTVSTGATMA